MGDVDERRGVVADVLDKQLFFFVALPCQRKLGQRFHDLVSSFSPAILDTTLILLFRTKNPVT